MDTITKIKNESISDSLIELWAPVLDSDIGTKLRSHSEAQYMAFALEIQSKRNMPLTNQEIAKYFVPLTRRFYSKVLLNKFKDGFRIDLDLLSDKYIDLNINEIIQSGETIATIDLDSIYNKFTKFSRLFSVRDIDSFVLDDFSKEAEAIITDHIDKSAQFGFYWYEIAENNLLIKYK